MHDVVAGCIHGVDINPMASCLGTSTSVRGLHKIGAYFPCPIKVWLNGHEWAKRPATQTALATGFASCDDQGLLLRTCNSLCPVPIQAFFDFWLARLPLPLTAQDRSHGCYWDCRLGQVEMARTLVSTSRGTGRRSSTPLENSNAYMLSNDERRFALVVHRTTSCCDP